MAFQGSYVDQAWQVNSEGKITSERPVVITDNTASSSKTTGALIVTGGVGVTGNSTFGGFNAFGVSTPGTTIGLNSSYLWTSPAALSEGLVSISSGLETSADNANGISAVTGSARVTAANTKNWTNPVGFAGFRVRVANFNATANVFTVTGAAGLHVLNGSNLGAGILANQYGIYLEGMTSAGTTNYGIYFSAASTTADIGFAAAGKIQLAAAGLTVAGSGTTGISWAQTNSTLTSGQMMNLTLSGSSAVATAANTGSILSLVSTATGFATGTQVLSHIDSSGANSNASVILQGLSITMTNTGTTNTNTGISIAVSGASTSNFSLNVTAGQVRINNDPVSGRGYYGTSTQLTSGEIMTLALAGTSVVVTGNGKGSVLTLEATNTGWTTAGTEHKLLGVFSSGANTNASVTLRGGVFSVTNTGTTNTNVALVLTASGGSTDNIALYITAGVFQLGAAISTTANQFSTGSLGAATTQMFIGNASINVTSDIRLKKDIVPTSKNAMDTFKKLRVVDYTWDNPADKAPGNKNSRGRFTGMIAQEMVDVVPWIINAPDRTCETCRAGRWCDRHESFWFVEYEHLVPLVVKGFQEVGEELASLKDQLIKLRSRIEVLEGVA